MTTLTKAQADLWIDYYDATKGKHPMPTDHASPVTWTIASVHLVGKAADVVNSTGPWPPDGDPYWTALQEP